ncbi:hypothetical protein M0805_009325 [Coniferiporia weirii]|nr:hypothetical protein M0805_009325 [Coniferiporia weirii]
MKLVLALALGATLFLSPGPGRSLLAESPLASADTQEPFLADEPANPVAPVISADLSAFVTRVLREQSVRGLALGVVRPDGDIELGAWGNSSESGDAVDADTLFSIGSCSKAFLAASLGILMDDFAHGRNVTPLPPVLTEFGWETKVKDLLPDDWELGDEWQQEKANLRDILSHVSGVVGHDLSYGSGDTARDIVRRLRYHYTPFELRQRFAYNNEMYVTATYILTTYSGVPFSEFLRERIFVPLGMNASTISPASAAADGKLSQSWASSGRRIPFWLPEESMPTIGGAGAIISSIRDMTKWLAVLLNEGVDPLSNKTIIPKSTFEASTTASVIMSGTGSGRQSIAGYGMGWLRTSYLGHETVMHTGGIPGFLSLVQFLPHAKLGVVSLTNSDGGNVVNNLLSQRIVNDVLGLGSKDHDENPSEGSQTAAPTSEKSKSDPALSLRPENYAGTYTSPDYGNVTFCASLPPDYKEIITSSDYCSSLLHDFALVDNAQDREDSPKALQLLASYSRIWSSHLRFVHKRADVFTVTATTLFPQGYGTDTSPFSYDFGAATAHFIIAGSEPDRQVTGFSVCGLLRDAESAQGDCESGIGAKPGSLVRFTKVADGGSRALW